MGSVDPKQQLESTDRISILVPGPNTRGYQKPGFVESLYLCGSLGTLNRV